MNRTALAFASLGIALALVLAADPSAEHAGQATAPGAGAQTTRTEPPRMHLTVDSIMRGPALVGFAPTGLRWSADSRELYFEWRRPGEEQASTYVVGRDGGEPRKLSDGEKLSAPPASGTWDAAKRRALFTEDGDVFIFDAPSRSRIRVTRTAATESNVRWVRGETAVSYTRENNLYVITLAAGAIEQVTDVTPRRRETRETDSQRYVKAEEQKLIEYTREQTERRKKAEEERRQKALPSFEIQEGQSAVDLALSPGGDHVFILVSERAAGARTAEVPNYVTESAYSEMIQARALVGDAQERRRLAVLNIRTGKSVWADSAFAGKVKVQDKTPGSGAAAREVDREVRWSMPLVSKDGTAAAAMVRAADFKDQWIVTVDAESGKATVIDALHDDAWVLGGGGPGGAGFGWMPDHQRIWFVAEKDGWQHLWVAAVTKTGAPANQLTSGRFEVSSVSVSADQRRFYFTSSEKHPGERQFYSMPIEGGTRTAITTMTGSNAATPSPDDSTVALVHSYANRPPELFLMPNTPGAAAKQVTTTPTAEWRSFKWADPQVLTFKARDGADVYARLFVPEMLGARRDPAAPGVIFVHGAGYAQNAHKYWASYYREYMFHNLLASRGYVVLDVDYRASSGYGRDWRTAIYRHMGGKDLDDIVDGAKYLVSAHKVHPKRIGVYGGSYGGFITLMAMFTAPDVFAAGAALRPVTDWAHYNHGYTGAILNLPQEDAEAYRKSSPIYFAGGLQGALLICHGVVDTNVHVQDSVRLAQRLIELRKENWELALYPVENHGFETETSWADEYKRILKLFETNLRLAPGRAAAR